MNQPALLPPQEKVMVAPEVEQAAGISLGDVFRSLSKNKWLILACTIICAGVSLAYIAETRPIYEATASIRIDPTRAGSLGLNDLLSGDVGGSSNEVQTDIAILKSDEVSLATLNSLTPEEFKTYAGFDKSKMNFTPSASHMTPLQENLLAGFKGSLNAKQVEGTQLVQLTFQNGNPEIAATIVNATVQAFIRQNFESRYSSVNQVQKWLGDQMDDLRQRATAAQKRLSDYQEANNVLGTDPSNNTVMDRLRDLNDRLTAAEGDRIVKQAQLRAAQTSDPAVLASIVPDTTLDGLQQQEATLYGQQLQLASKFGSNYPPLRDVNQQLAQIRSQIAADMKHISERLQEDYNASASAEQMLRSQYEQATNDAYKLNRSQADYAVLASEASSSRDLFNTLQYKLEQASVDAGLNSVDTMIVDHARAPLVPVFPKKTMILSFGILLGFSTGVGGALLRESLSDEVRSIAQIESRTGLVTLATVPHLAPEAITSGEEPLGPHLITVREPRSRIAEAYRSLRNSVLLSSIDRPPRTILVTSSVPGEGKSTTSVNYAIVLAQKGGRVLLIDADLRRPTLHRHFRVRGNVGLTDHILGEQTGSEFVTPIQELPNLHFLPAGRNLPFPSEALSSARFQSLIQEWGKYYDTILLDSAPVITVSDTLPIATWAEATVIVVRAGQTPMNALLRTRALLARARGRISGVVLNDIKSLDEGYGYYGKGGYEYYK